MAEQVLVVEDSRAMRQFVSAVLEATGDWIVHQVDNGFEALRALPRGDYHLIITDINMPDVSGIEITRFVRESGRHGRTPVVVISTDASATDTRRALEAGASAFLAKPFTPEDLIEAIARARNGEASS